MDSVCRSTNTLPNKIDKADDNNDDSDYNTADDEDWSGHAFVINPPLMGRIALDSADLGN